MLDNIKRFVDRAIQERDASTDPKRKASDIWQFGIDVIGYVRQLDEAELKFLRRHTFHFTGDNYQRYSYGSTGDRNGLLEQTETAFGRLPGFSVEETSSGIGYDGPRGRISFDLLRYVTVLADLVEAGCLSPVDRKDILEIGGGYGGLARTVLAYSPGCSYTLCDLEETLFYSAVYLKNMIGEDRIHLVEDTLVDSQLTPGHFFLVPQARLDRIRARFDLTLNQQSMQEMTEAQVARYFEFMSGHSTLFYSRNYPSHDSIANADFVGGHNLVRGLNDFIRNSFPTVVWSGPKETGTVGDAWLERIIVRCDDDPAVFSSVRSRHEVAIREMGEKLTAAEVRLNEILKSRSWRITAPLRALWGRIGR
jgi:hypothetical protein